MSGTRPRKGTITALAPWFGGKRTLSREIVRQLGPHTSYFEPFCGSMAVLFNKPPAKHEVVNDLNRDLVNAARVIQTPALASQLLTRLHFTFMAEEAYRAARAVVVEPFAGEVGDVDRAYHALVFWWLGRNGLAGLKRRHSGSSFAARYAPTGGCPAVRFRSFVASVPFFARRLASVIVCHRDAFGLIEKIPDRAGVAVYCDPPYIEKSAKYEHDFADADHDRLAIAVARFRNARVVVSYYPHERLADLYPPGRWDRVELTSNKQIRNTDTRKGFAVKATEVLLVGGPAAQSDLFGR